MSEAVLAEGLSRYYKSGGHSFAAVEGIDLHIATGEMVAILGRSGSGKTTLLSLIGGIDRPDRGSVMVAGSDLNSLSPEGLDAFRRRSVGWVFQASGLLPLLTSAENVALSLRLQGVRQHEAMKAGRDALERVQLGNRADHRAYELSGGEQQRVALARALVKAPAVLLADEPTGQLDTETAASLAELLRSAATDGTAVVVATHDTALAETSNRVLRLEDGRLLA